MPNVMFLTLDFATVREREGRHGCLVAKVIYYNITKFLRLGNIASVVQCNPFKSIKFAILSRRGLCIHVEFRNDERGKEKDSLCVRLYY